MSKNDTNNYCELSAEVLFSMGYKVSEKKDWQLVHESTEGKDCVQLFFDWPYHAGIHFPDGTHGIGAWMEIYSDSPGRYVRMDTIERLRAFHVAFGIPLEKKAS